MNGGITIAIAAIKMCLVVVALFYPTEFTCKFQIFKKYIFKKKYLYWIESAKFILLRFPQMKHIFFLRKMYMEMNTIEILNI